MILLLKKERCNTAYRFYTDLAQMLSEKKVRFLPEQYKQIMNSRMIGLKVYFAVIRRY